MNALRAMIAGGLAAGLLGVAVADPAAGGDAPASPPPAPAGYHEGWHHPDGGPMGMFHELGLTDAQRGQLKAIFDAAKPAMQALHEQMRANERLLHGTSPDDKGYQQVVAKVSEENGALAAKAITQHAKLYAQAYALLAPIQKTRLAELQAQRPDGDGWHGGCMHGHMPFMHEHPDDGPGDGMR